MSVSDEHNAQASGVHIPWRRVRWSDAVSLALPATRQGRTDAFGLSPLRITPSCAGAWTGARAQGAPVNADSAQLSIHGSGTHTECAAHICDLPLRIADVAPLELLPCLVLEITPKQQGNDSIITRSALETAWQKAATSRADAIPAPRAVIIRSRRMDEPPHRPWSGTHPPFFGADAIEFLVGQNIEHLVTDLPSVDPENDHGALAAHAIFWGLNDTKMKERSTSATITELAWVPHTVPPGFGLLRLDVLAWASDAAPSRPVFYPVSPTSTVQTTSSAPSTEEFRAGTMRHAFHLPRDTHGHTATYLCGHSLGAMPIEAENVLQQGMQDWAQRAVDGHFQGEHPWFHIGETLRASMGRIVGAQRQDVVLTGTLTANLHRLLRSFYRPQGRRTKILMEHSAFPSDRFCIRSHIASRGLDPDAHTITVRGQGPAGVPNTDEVLAAIETHGDEIATILLPGVSYITGAVYDLRRITASGHNAGALVGWDLAHAAGNIEVDLEANDIDFAAWCTYKYLNGGPGAIGGLFVHPRHTEKAAPTPARYEGWWGNHPDTRFTPNVDFEAAGGAASWQLSNVPVFSVLPLYASLPMIDAVGIQTLAAAGRASHTYLRELLQEALPNLSLLTPSEAHGTQLSLEIAGRAEIVQESLQARGIVCDTRGENILRVAPVPLYNNHGDIERFVHALTSIFSELDITP